MLLQAAELSALAAPRSCWKQAPKTTKGARRSTHGELVANPVSLADWSQGQSWSPGIV